MKFTEPLIKEYAKKIYGFAYSQTHDCHEADDLSQEIALALCGISFPEKQIDNMDAYIYTVCRYTWSKYLRKNKPFLGCLCGNECIELVKDESCVENDFITAELCDRLRQEIVYLGRVRRETIIMFYYDNKSGEEISTVLGIPAATVRWHLHKARNELKERMEMTEKDAIYRPVRLSVGHHGWQGYDVYSALETDILMQNICYVCFDNPMTVEEISRRLGVAAAYLEDKLDKLCSMEYMTKSAKGKYQTNFFVRGAEYQLEHSRYQFEKTLPIARSYYEIVKAALPKIKEIGFYGEVSDDILMWDVMLYFMMREIGETDCRRIKAMHLEHGAPPRPDGTRHWVRAALSMDEVLKSPKACGDDFREFFKTAGSSGIKGNNLTPDNLHSFQFNSPFLSEWRTISKTEMLALKRARDLISKGEKPNDFDKQAIAALIEKGYALRDGEALKLLVPYFDREQAQKLDSVLKEYADERLDRSEIDKVFFGYVEHMRKFIPDCVCENERNHYLTSYDPHNAVLYLLMQNGLLRRPDESERRNVCTILWES